MPARTRSKLRDAPLAELKAGFAPYNPRRISKREMDSLQRSLKEFGPVQAAVWNTRTETLVGGHQRILAAERLRWRTYPTYDVDLEPGKERLLNLGLNRISGEWDETRLVVLLAELEAEGEDISLTGFDDGEVEKLLASLDDRQPKPDLDTLPTGPPKRAKRGDLFLLGEHRLMCADATSEDDVATLCAGEPAAMVFTDPPYGVSYEARSGKHKVIEGDDLRRDGLIALLTPALKRALDATEPTAAFYVWHASSSREDFAYAIKAAGLAERQYLIWAKPSIVLGHSDYRWAHEPCFYASRTGERPAFYGDRAQSTIWRLEARTEGGEQAAVIGPGVVVEDGHGGSIFLTTKKPKGKGVRPIRLGREPLHLVADDGQGTVWEVARDTDGLHPTQKPVELARRAIGNSSRRGEVVLDTFAGSGSTLIGAEVTGRRCFAMDLDPRYVDTILARWEALTGATAEKA